MHSLSFRACSDVTGLRNGNENGNDNSFLKKWEPTDTEYTGLIMGIWENECSFVSWD